jgi:hypothetical protein
LIRRYRPITPASASKRTITESLVGARAIKAVIDLRKPVGSDVRRTQDIDPLASQTRVHWRDFLPEPFPLAAVSHWYMTTRYPGLDAPPPGRAEIVDALEAVTTLIALIPSHAPPGSMTDGGTDAPLSGQNTH